VRIGLIVDGDSEYASLRLLFPHLSESTTNVFLKPVKAKFHPESPYGAIARACVPSVKLLEAKGAERVVVLLDRESRAECPGAISSAVKASLSPRCKCELVVVVKDRKYENWLISDMRAFRNQQARFRISAGIRSSIEPNKADHVDGDALLRRIVRGTYDKVADSKRVLHRADPIRMAKNSRSFRRFLRCVGHPDYGAQSEVP